MQLADLSDQRAAFNVPPGIAYFNTANLAPQLHAVRAAGTAALERRGQPWTISAEDWFVDVERLRALFARIVGSDPDGVALVPATSYGFAVAARNLPLRPGERVLVLDEEYPSGIYTWRAAARRSGAELLTIRRQAGQSWADAVLAALDERVAIVSVPNVHWTDGAFVDLAAIAARSHELGARLVIDGSQSVGALPLQVDRLRPDFLITVGYKWLLGPFGVGYLYVAEEHRQGEPLEENWILRAGSEDFARLVDYRDDYQPGARRFDVGQRTKFELTPMAIAALEQILELAGPEDRGRARGPHRADRDPRAGARPDPAARRRARAAHARRAASGRRARARAAGARRAGLLRRGSRRLAADRAAPAHHRRRRRSPRSGLDERAGGSTRMIGRALRTVVDDCLAVRAGERVLVIADPDTLELGRTLLDAVREVTADVVLAVVPADPARGNEPPLTVAAALAACDVFLAPCLPSMSHTTAREAATEGGARGATLPGVTSDMLARLMGGDFEAIARRSRAVADLLTEGREAHVTCPLGTDMRFALGGRAGIADDGDLRERAAFGNLPCGEAFIAPTGGEGRVVVSSIATLGMPDEPVELVVQRRPLAHCGGAAGQRLEQALTLTASGDATSPSSASAPTNARR